MLLLDLLDLALPRCCAGCTAPGAALCPGCRTPLHAVPSPTRPAPCPPGFPRTVAVTAYAGAARAALLAHKEDGRISLAAPLGSALARAVEALGPPPGALLVPVPSSRAAVRARGHDHAWRLARAAGRRAPGVRPARVLVPARAVADQAGLGTAARAANLAGALAVRPRARGLVAGRPVVVVDDVVTTGATLVEAARALTAAGALVHGAAVVAATRRRAVIGPGAALSTTGGEG